jgi:hypothetical protein
MKTFLSKIPQQVDFESLFELDPSLDTAVRDLASSVGMPATIGHLSLLDTLAAIRTAQMIHDAEDKDAFNKGVIQGLLIAAQLPDLCQQFLKSKQPKEGTPQ